MFGQHPTAMDVGLMTAPMGGRASLSSYPTRIALPVVPPMQSTNQFSSVLQGLNSFGHPNSAPPMPGVE